MSVNHKQLRERLASAHDFFCGKTVTVDGHRVVVRNAFDIYRDVVFWRVERRRRNGEVTYVSVMTKPLMDLPVKTLRRAVAELWRK